MTDQTPESVIAEAMVNAGAPLMHSRVEDGVAAALRAANLLREPGVPDAATESLRREAAVLELRNRYGQSNGTQTWIEFQGDPHFIVNQVLAALDGAPVIDEAAAGVAPPAPSEYAYCPIHGDLLAANRSYRCGNAPTGHEYAAQAQPSSTVDEAALAEVIATANYDWSQQRLEFWRRPASVESPGSLDEFTARAIAEYLTGGTK